MKPDYYSLLEIWPSCSIEDVKNSYFRLAKLHHPDVAGDTPENRERFKLINEAYSILSNPQERHQYDEYLRKSKKGSKDASLLLEKDRRSASLAFTQGREALKQGRLDKAALLFKNAIKYDDTNPNYHTWYGFCLAMLNTELHEARDHCKKAVQMEFYNADYHANLGFVYFKAGLKNLAVKHFTEAQKWDPDNALARKFMAKLDGDTERPDGPIDKIASGVKVIFSKIF